MWQRRFDDPIVLTDGISKVRRPDARGAFYLFIFKTLIRQLGRYRVR